MHPQVRDSVLERLHTAFGEVQRTKQTMIGSPIRSFVTDLVVEALEIRKEEWLKRHGLSPDDPAAATGIADIVGTAVQSIATDAAIYKSTTGRNHVLLIGVVEETHRQFCKIFPFCR